MPGIAVSPTRFSPHPTFLAIPMRCLNCFRLVARILTTTVVVSLLGPSSARAAQDASGLKAVPTYESIGLEWTPTGGSANNPCAVRYREQGATAWNTGYPLWFATDTANTSTVGYRGSIVHVSPGTTYEIELELASGTTSGRFLVSTWTETANLPIGVTVEVASSAATLDIAISGTATAYRLYTPAAGQTSTLDVARGAAHCVTVAPGVHHVIIRGLICKGATGDAISLGTNVSNVIIEENDISGWGSPGPNDPDWGIDRQSGVRVADGTGVSRITVQRNRIHHPFTNANLWSEYNGNDARAAKASGNYHPHGPQGITFTNPEGEIVLRYNEIYSDNAHRFNDGISGADNFSANGHGSFAQNSDIHGNRVASFTDDGLEIEGANKNVRVWGNYIEGLPGSKAAIAVAWTAVGPIYLWRNVAGPRVDELLKTQQKSTRSNALANGRIFLFHNTLIGPSDKHGIAVNPMRNLYTRNNILHTPATRPSINDADAVYGANNDFNYDLFAGTLVLKSTPPPAPEPQGIHGAPTYDREKGAGYLAAGSLGLDQGEFLANFSDGYVGSGPDMGAQEKGRPPLEFGVAAYRSAPPPAR